jgi:hypothetical protein
VRVRARRWCRRSDSSQIAGIDASTGSASRFWSWRASCGDGVERLEQDPDAHAEHQREHRAEDHDQRALGALGSGAWNAGFEHAELLAELTPLELRLHGGLVVALREVLERVEQVLVLDLERVELLRDRGRRVELGLELLGDLGQRSISACETPRAARRGAPAPRAAAPSGSSATTRPVRRP